MSISKNVFDMGNYTPVFKNAVRKLGGGNGGADAALILSEAMNLSSLWERLGKIGKDGFFYWTVEDVKTEFDIKEDKQRTIFNKLKKYGLLEIEIRYIKNNFGVPIKTRFLRVNFDKVDTFILELPEERNERIAAKLKRMEENKKTRKKAAELRKEKEKKEAENKKKEAKKDKKEAEKAKEKALQTVGGVSNPEIPGYANPEIPGKPNPEIPALSNNKDLSNTKDPINTKLLNLSIIESEKIRGYLSKHADGLTDYKLKIIQDLREIYSAIDEMVFINKTAETISNSKRNFKKYLSASLDNYLKESAAAAETGYKRVETLPDHFNQPEPEPQEETPEQAEKLAERKADLEELMKKLKN